jgi:hypothetical protein
VYQLRLFGILLRPSLVSFIVTTGATFVVLSVSNWSYVTHSPLFYDYFFGRYGITTILQESRNSILDAKIFYQTYTYDIVVLLVAILAGILVYIVLESFSHGLAGAKEAIDEIEESHGASRHSVEVELATRWMVRVASIVLWAVYWIFFINALLPFCILTSRVGASDLSMWPGWLYNLLGFGVLWLGFHQHIIFARLVVLRPRLFGGRNVMDAELYRK